MLAHHRWGLRSLVAVGLLVFAARQSNAQVFQPGVNPFPGTPNVWNPWGQQYANPNFPWKRQGNAPPNNNGVRVMPSINSMPGILGSSVFPPVMNFSSWSDPALDNPWMNQSSVIPVRIRPPFVMNPFFNDPFALNPLLQQRAWANRFNFPGYEPRTSLL
ncbi:MAG TPA: hypothetical protein VLM40_12075, partial [Gemmata sp.]|nr:hypothetical protein [Gemmata sp.]